MKGAHISFGRQLFQRQVALKMLVDVRDGVSHGSAVDLVFSVFLRRIQKIVQELCDIAGQFSLKNGGRGPEYIINFLKLDNGGVGTFRVEDLIVP